jgi:hypothetical protein
MWPVLAQTDDYNPPFAMSVTVSGVSIAAGEAGSGPYMTSAVPLQTTNTVTGEDYFSAWIALSERGRV